MKRIAPTLALLFLFCSAYGQNRPKFLYAEFADQSVTFYPFYKPFGSNFDPAVSLGGGIDYRQNGNLTLFQTVQLTGYKTFVAGDGFHLTSSFGYRYDHSSGLFGEVMLGLGTSLFFSSRQSYTMDENGIYEPTYPLHFVAELPLDLLIGYGIGKLSFYIKYRYMVEAPYTESMPILPTSLLGLGLRYNISEAGK